MSLRPLPLLALLAACAEPATDDAPAEPCVGLDADGDGVCDRENADFSRDATIPAGTDRANIYGLSEADLAAVRERGLVHASIWPVDVSGLLLPYAPLAAFFDGDTTDPQKQAMVAFARQSLGFGTMEEMYDWLGLPPYPTERGTGLYQFPDPGDLAPADRMGAGLVETRWGDALTFSCATCHATSLFGKTVVGLTNRKARANEFFHLATLFYPSIEANVFAELTGATDDEVELFLRTQANLSAVGAKTPETLGLDTALAQVGLSLSRRAEDAWATKDPTFEASPRPNPLDTLVADSKPAVWWNLKHKTRWLSDGAIVAGNPIFTNFLWNEIGRSTDLHELDAWLTERAEIVDELTVAVFSTPAPRWTDFPLPSIDLEAAKRGATLFDRHCSSCHGSYEKGWEADDAATRSDAELLATTHVVYHEQTPVLDVGTDPERADGIQHFGPRLNELEISHRFGTVVEEQTGYVPPPLEGVWARFPYLHNQSVPSLCALLSPAEQRPTEFWIGPTDDPETDFDATCVGYPVGDAVPDHFKAEPRARFDTTAKPGLSNTGHDSMLLDGDGNEILSADDKADLIAFLKTL
jgi:mono/diheme cytochrome c family protein